MTPIFITQTISTFAYHDFDLLVRDTYQNAATYEVVRDMEPHNDSIISIGQTDHKPLDEWEVAELEDFITIGEADSGWMAPILIQDMVNRDILPVGNYQIDVSW